MCVCACRFHYHYTRHYTCISLMPNNNTTHLLIKKLNIIHSHPQYNIYIYIIFFKREREKEKVSELYLILLD